MSKRMTIMEFFRDYRNPLNNRIQESYCRPVVKTQKRKDVGRGYYTSDVTFPEIIIITTAYTYGAKLYEFSFLDPMFTYRTALVEADFELEVLEENEVPRELLESRRNYRIANLSDNLYHYFMVGSDPEIFVVDKDDNLIPAFDFLPAKNKAVDNGRAKIYWDGFQAEISPNPETCLAYHTDYVQSGMAMLLIEARKKHPGAKLSLKTVMNIPEDLLKNGKDEHVQFGCMPSMNAYGLQGNTLPGREVTFRPAGGHLHFGTGKLKPEVVARVIKALDAVIGVACVSLFASFDDPRRRRLYGLPGEYRLPPHGIEYRTLSNAWLAHPMIMSLVYDVARKVVMAGIHDLMPVLWKATEEETVQCILNSDVDKAREILTRNKDAFKNFVKAAYSRTSKEEESERVFNIYLNGMESAVENPNDIIGNWNLEGGYVSHRNMWHDNFLRIVKGMKAGTYGNKIA